jgi:hypothetical protein
VKKLLKQNTEVQHLDISLEFDGGKFFATLRLYRGNRGMLEVIISAFVFFEYMTSSCEVLISISCFCLVTPISCESVELLAGCCFYILFHKE